MKIRSRIVRTKKACDGPLKSFHRMSFTLGVVCYRDCEFVIPASGEIPTLFLMTGSKRDLSVIRSTKSESTHKEGRR